MALNNKHATLKDIAEVLMVSKVTVSKALRDHPDIGLETKNKVKEVARKIGYMPNLMARNLSSRKSTTIGLIVPKIAHHFFSDVIEAIYQKAYECNYDIILTVSQENPENEAKHIETLLSMHVDAILVSVTQFTKSIKSFTIVKSRNVPLVFFDRVIEQNQFSTISSDDEEGAYNGVKKMIDNGVRKIAHFSGYGYTSIGNGRLKGFMRAMHEANLDVKEDWILEGGFSVQDGYDSFKKLQQTGKMPEMIFTVTYPVALGALKAARETGVKIPGDLELFSFGGADYLSLFSPSIPYIAQPARELGVQAFKLVYEEALAPYSRPAKHMKIATSLVFSNSLIMNQ
ncbi:MAG: LacI family DNA-binding transcriptional regulator [Calditrichaceae bacterium]|nr:LacI family DNA-binding transcriptional regulator [Calditrichaceae bacterium]MBN2708177.1 LacI family DNA-binding transcriptional regulator [Calditrichaceae bacterium]RQV97175.1 MAG: LacI family transcriptional regulator [Calditrichota bacterium]